MARNRKIEINIFEVASRKDAIVVALGKDLPLKAMSELYMDYVLATCGGNKVRAAKVLGIDRRTLQRREKKAVPVPPETLPYPVEQSSDGHYERA